MADQLDLPLRVSPSAPERVRLPDERRAVTKKFTIIEGDEVLEQVDVDCPHCGGKVKTMEAKKIDLNGYVTVGTYPDGNPGEMFLKIGKPGGRYSVYDALCVAISIGLQYGVPLSVFVNKFMFMRFEPSGFTGEDESGIPIAKSIPDYLAKWMHRRFVPDEDVPAERQQHGLMSIVPGVKMEGDDGSS